MINPTGATKPWSSEVFCNVFAYWPRWVTARRLAAERCHNPARAGWMERISAAVGINLQLDEVL